MTSKQKTDALASYLKITIKPNSTMDGFYLDGLNDLDDDYYSDEPVSNKGLPYSGCFGYIDGHLLVGHHHHQAIMAQLLDKGWTWEDLFEAEQVWGWFNSDTYNGKSNTIFLDFVSDAAIMNEEAVEGCKAAFAKLYDVDVEGEWDANRGDVRSRQGLGYGGDFDNHYGPGRHVPSVIHSATPIPEPPNKDDRRREYKIRIR